MDRSTLKEGHIGKDHLTDNEKVDRTVQILLSDYDRRDGYLPKSHVERVLDKRRLSIEECVEVYRQLELVGVTLEDESDDADSALLLSAAEEGGVSPDSVEAYNRFAERLRSQKTRLLSAEEEVELGRRMELGRRAKQGLANGDVPTEVHADIIKGAEQARERMIVANLRLVLHTARPYLGVSDLSLEDMTQEGTIGLMRAVEKYDHTLGHKFSTYATWWIRQSISRAIADRGATIRLPLYVYADVYQLKRAYKLFTQIHPERRPTIGELADELVWTTDKVHFMQQVGTLVAASLDQQLPGHDDLAVVDTLISSYESPEEYVERMALVRDIQRALETLKDREREILSLRFGLNGSGEGLTLEDIGQRYCVTRERIRQIEAKALERIERSVRANPEHCLSAYRSGGLGAWGSDGRTTGRISRR